MAVEISRRSLRGHSAQGFAVRRRRRYIGDSSTKSEIIGNIISGNSCNLHGSGLMACSNISLENTLVINNAR